MAGRLAVAKTYKLFIGGKFPRSESGRSMEITGAAGSWHLSRASRKDVRDAVEAARKGHEAWTNATAYNRGQVLYRLAEMVEGKRRELTEAIGATGAVRGPAAKREVEASIDRLIAYAGWADKYAQVLGCNNPVGGPFYNFTVPEPTGVVGVIAPDAPSLLGLVALAAPVLCSGNSAVALASSTNPIPAAILAEAVATSDMPAGAFNILTGERGELLPHFASHGEIGGIHAAGLSAEQATVLRAGAGDNLKRVLVRERVRWFDEQAGDPWWIEPFVEMKTMWHPSGI